MNFTSTTQAVATLGEERTLRLIHSALKSQERSKERSKQDRELLKMYKNQDLGGTRVNLTVEN